MILFTGRLLLPALCACMGLPVIAQTTGDSSLLSIQKAIDLTIAHFPSVKTREAAVDAARASLHETRFNNLPNIRLGEELALGTNNNLNGSYYPLGFIPSTSGGRRDRNMAQPALGNLMGVNADWEIYNFGAYTARYQEAASAVAVQENNLALNSYDLRNQVIATYLELVRYNSLAAIQQKNIDRTAEILRAVSAFVVSGLKPAVDSAIAAAELSKARLNFLDIVNAVQSAKIQLANFTGLDTAAIRVETSLYQRIPQVLAENLSQDSVFSTHPLLRYRQSIYENNLAAKNRIHKDLLPKVSVMASAWARGSSITPADEYKSPVNGFAYSRYNYVAGIGITYNLTDGKRTRLREQVQQALSQLAWQGWEEDKVFLQQAFNQADNNLQTAIRKWEEMPYQKDAATAAYTQKNALYAAGLTNIIELTNTLYLLNRAETDEVQVSNAVWRALYQKMAAGNQVNYFLTLFNR